MSSCLDNLVTLVLLQFSNAGQVKFTQKHTIQRRQDYRAVSHVMM